MESENEGDEVNERKKSSRVGRGEPGKRYEDRFNITEERKSSLLHKRGRPKLFDSDGKSRCSLTLASPDRGLTSSKRSNCLNWKSKFEADYEEHNDQILDEFVTNLSKDSDEFPRKFAKLEERYHAVILDYSEVPVISNEVPNRGTSCSSQLLWKPDDNGKQTYLSKIMLDCRSSLCVPGTILQASSRNQACYVCVLGPSIASNENSGGIEDMLVVFDGENNRVISALKCSPLVAEDEIIAILEGLYFSNTSNFSSISSSSCYCNWDDWDASSHLLSAAVAATHQQWNVLEIEEYLCGREKFQNNVIKIYNNSTIIPIIRSMKNLIYFHEYFLALTRTAEGHDTMRRLFRRAKVALEGKALGSSYVLHFRRGLFTIKLLHKYFHCLCSLLMPYCTSLCVLRRTCRQE
jgi:hypothetical protein